MGACKSYLISYVAFHLLAFSPRVQASTPAASADDQDTATITGTVRTSASYPIPEAVVSVYKIDREQSLAPDRYRAEKVVSTATDRDGNYTIPRLPSGEYLITCVSHGWLRAEYWGLMLLPGTTQVTDFWLVTPQGDGVFPRITWSGTVRSSGGEAVADATVIAIDLQGLRLATQCRADRSGRYEMIVPRAGNNYILYASKPGYTPTPIVVRTAADKELDLVLSPNKAGPDSR